MGQKGPKRGPNEALGPYLAQNALVFGHLHIEIENDNIYYLMVVKVPKKIAGPEMGPFWP